MPSLACAHFIAAMAVTQMPDSEKSIKSDSACDSSAKQAESLALI
jgi:hypothetical protein